MKLRILVAAALSLVLSAAAHAQTAGFYSYKDTAANIFNMKIWQTGTNPIITTPSSVSSDGFGLPLSGAAGTTNPNGRALYVQGVTGGVPFHMVCDSGCGGGGGSSGAVFGPTAVGAPAANPPVLIGGTVDGTATGSMSAWKVLAGVGFINCANCSGSGISVAYTGPIGTVGTPGGFKDGSNNFQALLGDVTNGQWVSVKASVLPTGAATQTTLAAIQTALGSPFQAGGSIANTSFGISGTLPAFAATPTVNLGTLNGAATASLQTSGNASLSSIDTKTPSLGQALAAASVPIVLTAAQLTTLTPPAAITGFALDTTVQTTNTDLGAPGVTVCATDTGSCSLNALLQRNNARSTSIITALGSPFQAGASIGNTSFGISGTLPAYAATPTFNLGTLNGAATAANQTSVIGSAGGGTAATNALLAAGQYNSSPITLTTTQQAALQVDASGYLKVNVVLGGGGSATFGAAFPATGVALGVSQGGNLVAVTGTAGNLNVQCANCSGSGVSTADGASFVAGTSLFAGTGGIYQTTATSNPLTNGTQGLAQLTINRAMHVNLRTAAGVNLGDATTPLQVSLANTGANATAMLVTGTGGTFPVTGTVTANAGTNLNTSLLALETGGNLASLVTQIGAVTASPTANTVNDRLKTINTTLGTPFQAGGSIGNTSFAVTQATAASLNATVVGTGTFLVQAAQSGSWTVTANAGTNLNTSLLALETGGNLASIKTNTDNLNLSQGSTTSGQKGNLVLGAVTTAAPSYTTAQSSPLSLSVGGLLRVDASGATVPVTLTSTTITGSVTVAQATASSLNATVVGTGTFATQSAITAASGSVSSGAYASGSLASGAMVDVVAMQTPIAAATATATKGNLIGGQYDSTQKTLTNGQQGAYSMSARGALFVAVGADGFAVTNAGTFATQSAITAASGSIASGAIASGAFASGAVSSGAYASGSLASGAVVDITNLSTPITPATATATKGVLLSMQYNSTQATFTNGQQGSVQGSSRGAVYVATGADTFNVTVSAALPGGTALLGKVGIDQTTPGTTNAVSIAQVGASSLALGSTTASASIPVVIASNQTAADPCMFQAKTNVAISTATGTTALVTGVSAKKIYVCSLTLVAPSAVSISLSEGSSSTCGTSAQAAVIGVATNGTAANGMATAANGGLTLGNGGGTVAATATNANYLCLFQSGTAQIAGNLTYVQQ